VTAVKVIFFPLDEQLGLINRWSEGLVKQVVWLSGLVVFKRVEEILGRVGQIAISDRSIWRRAQGGGEQLRQVLEAGCVCQLRSGPHGGRKVTHPEGARRVVRTRSGVALAL
jgi:hypothetical protein